MLGKIISLCKWLVLVMLFFTGCAQQEISPITREPAAIKQSNDLQRYAFEQCRSDSRLYLEDQIVQMPEEYYRSHEDEWSQKIPLSCVQFAQRNYRGKYATCPNESAKPKAGALKPCMTENYVRLTYNAYHDVMDCFNLDPKDYYFQILLESGFHINAFSQGFDSGITQFTGNGIRKVTANNLLQRTQSVLLNSSRPSCARISSIVRSFDISFDQIKNRCSMISLPQNPYRGMLFKYLHTMLDQISITKLISETPALSGLANDKIKRHLEFLAYNRGISGTNKLLDGYIQSRKLVGHKITADDFDLDKNLSKIKQVLRLDADKRSKLLKAKKIKNLTFAEYAVIHGATYLSDMTAAQDHVRRYLGDQCGRL